jgi:hypothetical protein
MAKYRFHGAASSVLSKIKSRPTSRVMLFLVTIPRRNAMSRNVGRIDQYVRIVVGLALVAFAFQDGLSIQGWHWAGLAGFLLLATAFFGSCPAYGVLGISTCERRIEGT